MFSQASVILFTRGGLGLCPGGLCSGRVSVKGGLCPGGLCHGDPPYGNERAVRILLECILVVIYASCE